MPTTRRRELGCQLPLLNPLAYGARGDTQSPGDLSAGDQRFLFHSADANRLELLTVLAVRINRYFLLSRIVRIIRVVRYAVIPPQEVTARC